MRTFNHIIVVGGGAWGTALAQVLSRKQPAVRLWVRKPELAVVLNTRRQNPTYLPNIHLNSNISAITSLEDLAYADLIILAVPSQFLPEMLPMLAAVIQPSTPVVIACKGFANDGKHLMHQHIRTVFVQNPLLDLTGPSFAVEVAQDLPTALVLAHDAVPVVAEQVLAAFDSERFHLHVTDDITGAQLGGACKNVVAIACGFADGRGAGQNAKAAIMTAGFRDIRNLGAAIGARAETILGLSGLGDLMLTCATSKSRNYHLGYSLGQGKVSAVARLESQHTVEGAANAAHAVHFAEQYNVNVPVFTRVAELLTDATPLSRTVEEFFAL